MNTPTLSILRDIADQLAVLAGILQIPGNQQRAQSIRKAEKSLVALESFFTPQLAQNVKQWKQSTEGLAVLRAKLDAVETKQTEIDMCQAKIEESRLSMEKWLALPEHERSKLLQHARIAQNFLENRIYEAEAHILNRYQRYHALKALVAYADNAEHLCEAIYHFENRQKYETNIVKLEQKKDKAKERLRSVRRGFVLALSFCVFLVTLPLCAPFAFSLWARRREIETQIANIDETIRREERRLHAADEGVLASETIREILGDVSLEQIRRTLTELRELRAEFQRPDKSTSITAELLAFLDLYQLSLANLFGEMPTEPVESVRWFVKNINTATHMEDNIRHFTQAAEELRAQQRQITKGYSVDILRHSLTNLGEVREKALPLPFDDKFKETFGDVSLAMPNLLMATRQALWHITHAQSVLESDWRNLQLQLQANCNILSACILDLEVQAHSGTTEGSENELLDENTAETMSESTPTAAVG